MKKEKNLYFIIAGVINLFTAILHTIGGQLELIDPLLESDLIPQAQYEILGAWHMVTLILFVSSFVLLKKGFRGNLNSGKELLTFISYLYLLFGLPSLTISLWYGQFVPQWILLMPIGALGLWGLRKQAELQKTHAYESA